MAPTGVKPSVDFHGDPTKANIVVFSDGNHHMALLHSLLEKLRVQVAELRQSEYIVTTTRNPVGMVDQN